MKMTMYYVARFYKSGKDSIGRSNDCEYVSGPFAFYSQAVDSRKEQSMPNRTQFEIVKSIIEVK